MEPGIIQGNKLIAEFMGFEWVGEDYVYDKHTDMAVRDELGLCVAEYHDTWEWIMPAVRKFISLSPDEFPYDITRQTQLRQCQAALKGMSIISPIEDVYNTLLTGINWYNEQKTTLC